jgi:hypothetical protein
MLAVGARLSWYNGAFYIARYLCQFHKVSRRWGLPYVGPNHGRVSVIAVYHFPWKPITACPPNLEAIFASDFSAVFVRGSHLQTPLMEQSNR